MIKRYYIDQEDDGDACACFMTQDTDGEYVTYADHRAAVRELVEALQLWLTESDSTHGSSEVMRLRELTRAAIAKHQEGEG